MKKMRSRRWMRAVVPPVVVLLVVIIGMVLYQWEQPDEDDPAYLSPRSTAAIGASTLADRVRAAGVTISRVEGTADVFVPEHRGDVTILLTTPQFVHPEYLRRMALLPATTRVVIVEPDGQTLLRAQMPLTTGRRALAGSVTAPGCDYGPATDAGPAGIHRTRYGPVNPAAEQEFARCYDDSLIVISRGWTTTTIAGSADPFRNDRIGEAGNARLVTSLLTTRPRLVWVDLHRHETPPKPLDPLPGPAEPTATQTAGAGPTATPTRDRDLPSGGASRTRGAPATPSAGEPTEAGADEGSNPLWSAFPAWIYVVAVLLLVVFLLYALARARRMGGPVVEPLPVVVRAGETVTGRGRLYHRAGARSESLRTLRAAATARMARLLRLDPGTDRAAFVAAVAEWSGWPPEVVDDTLYGLPPKDDEALVAAAVRLEALASTNNPTSEEGARR